MKNTPNVKLIHGDCIDAMRSMPTDSVDLVLADPPYGIGLQYDSYDDSEANWYKLMDACLPEIRRISKMAILPSCQIKRLPWIYQNHPPDWLMCWYKGSTGHASYIGFNDWEPHLVYGRRVNQLHMHDYFQTPSSPKMGKFGHPCPKPVEWASWLIKKVARNDRITVLDCFMGSGTTGVACANLKQNFIGIELDPGYFDIAKRRIDDANNTLF